jgi:NAD(P)-dependent dehydrogenase (short-subunit alcohol dehydrogenase family)
VDLGLANARVLVTRGASNIGRGIVHGFAAEGARIVIADVDEAQAAKVRAEAVERGAAEAELALGDLTTDGAGQRAVDPLLERWGGIDVLVNNAGWSVPGFIAADTDRAKWQKTVEINFFSAIACTQAAIPAMREAGAGSIVFIASDAAFGQIRQGRASTGRPRPRSSRSRARRRRSTAATASGPTSYARGWCCPTARARSARPAFGRRARTPCSMSSRSST